MTKKDFKYLIKGLFVFLLIPALTGVVLFISDFPWGKEPPKDSSKEVWRKVALAYILIAVVAFFSGVGIGLVLLWIIGRVLILVLMGWSVYYLWYSEDNFPENPPFLALLRAREYVLANIYWWLAVGISIGLEIARA